VLVLGLIVVGLTNKSVMGNIFVKYDFKLVLDMPTLGFQFVTVPYIFLTSFLTRIAHDSQNIIPRLIGPSAKRRQRLNHGKPFIKQTVILSGIHSQ